MFYLIKYIGSVKSALFICMANNAGFGGKSNATNIVDTWLPFLPTVMSAESKR